MQKVAQLSQASSRPKPKEKLESSQRALEERRRSEIWKVEKWKWRKRHTRKKMKTKIKTKEGRRGVEKREIRLQREEKEKGRYAHTCTFMFEVAYRSKVKEKKVSR